MPQASGAWSLKRSSSSIEVRKGLAWSELLLLVGLGAGAVALHAAFRWPLRLPGHHGLEWMALLLLGRCASSYRWAASVSSVSAAAFSALPVWGFDDPFIWLIYTLPGLVIDGGFGVARGWQQKIWFLAILGGGAHATKPLVRLVISILSGWPYGSLLYGVAYPLATHVLFGVLGGLLGATLVLGTRRKRDH